MGAESGWDERRVACARSLWPDAFRGLACPPIVLSSLARFGHLWLPDPIAYFDSHYYRYAPTSPQLTCLSFLPITAFGRY